MSFLLLDWLFSGTRSHPFVWAENKKFSLSSEKDGRNLERRQEPDVDVRHDLDRGVDRIVVVRLQDMGSRLRTTSRVRGEAEFPYGGEDQGN